MTSLATSLVTMTRKRCVAAAAHVQQKLALSQFAVILSCFWMVSAVTLVHMRICFACIAWREHYLHCAVDVVLRTCVLQVKTAVEEALEWLDDNQDAEEDDYREKLKEVEDTCGPIISSAYQAAGGPGGDDDDLDDHDEL